MKKIIFIFLFTLVALSMYLEISGEDITVLEVSNTNDLSLKYSNIIGKIEIEDTTLYDYLCQTTNNEYYLNHNCKDNLDKKGGIFLDYRNRIDDKKLLIYGHNSKNGEAPLKVLSNFLDKNFYQTHKYINLTIRENQLKYEIFSIMIVPKNNYEHTKLVFDKEEYSKHLKYLKENSIISTDSNVGDSDNIITIQTCNYSPEDSYLIISAKRC